LTRSRPFRLLLLLGLLSGVAGCEVLGFDHSTRVAKALLYHDAKPDAAAITAAMNARFPPGSELADLELFVKSLGGRCFKAVDAHPVCEIPVSGGFCVAHVISLSMVTSAGDRIQHVEASTGSEAC
jgi:hypothetical protein